MKDKKNMIIIAAILAVVFSLMFLLVRVTALFVVAYVFALIGVAGLLWGGFMLAKDTKSYPWIAAIPAQTLTYLIVEVLISAVVVLLEQLNVFELPVVWFIVIHAILLAAIAVRIIMLKGGAAHIESRGEEVGKKTQYMAILKTEVELAAEGTDDAALKGDIKKLAEDIRFSDPMSAEELAPIEMQLMQKVGELKASIKDTAAASAVVAEMNALLKERSAKVKIYK